MMARRALGSESEAEDLAQEVFHRVFAKAKTLREPERLRSFIFSFAIRVLKTELRRKRTQAWLSFHRPETLVDLGGELTDMESRDLLRRFYALLDRLAPRHRLVFALRHLESMTVEEVAAHMELSISTVKRALERATDKLSLLDRSRPRRWPDSSTRRGGCDDGAASRRREQGTARAGGPGRAGARQRAAADARRSSTAGSRRFAPASTAEQTAPRRRDGRSLRWSLVGTLAATAALVAVGVVRSGRLRAPAAPPALTYRIEGGSLVDGGYLRESGRAGIKLFFAEGTEFILMPGTRSRLRAVDASGARIAIEHGTASFQVTPAPRPPLAGRRRPVPGDGQGHRVHGVVGRRDREVRAQAPARPRDGERAGDGRRDRAARRPAPGGRPAPGRDDDQRAEARAAGEVGRGRRRAARRRRADASDKPAVQMGRPAATQARGDGERRWAAALAAGHLDRILAEAERAGVKATLDRASSDDLLALADAARYRRRMELAREALLAERRRFPDSPRSLDAAFLLGRVEEASDRGLARAIEWYDEYLTRAPTGTYASEALGRKMTLTSKLEGASRARPVAEEYLRRFPGGTYAGPARAFVRAP